MRIFRHNRRRTQSDLEHQAFDTTKVGSDRCTDHSNTTTGRHSVGFDGINFEGVHIGDSLEEKTADGVPQAPASGQNMITSIWSMYVKRATAFDEAFVESCREDMESLLLFSAIFSAVVTAFVVESYQKLQPDSGDLSATLLLRISGQLSPTDITNLVSLPSKFHPTKAAIFYNTCWFSSLLFSVGCSLGAIMVRQWILNYSQHVRDETTLPRQTRMRQYLFEGIQAWKMGTFVEFLPAMLHFSLFLFIMGLIAFLYEANTIVMAVVSILVVLAIIVYVVLTYAPVRWPDCPYQTPLSTPCVYLFFTITNGWQAIRHRKTDHKLPLSLRDRRKLVLSDSLDRNNLDIRALKWLLGRFTEGCDVLAFFAAVPNFVDNFPKGQDPTPQTIILEASSNRLSKLLASCLIGKSMKVSMVSSATVCLHALCSLVQAPRNHWKHVNWTQYFDSNMWSTLQDIQDRSIHPDISMLARCFLIGVVTQQLDRSQFEEPVDRSVAHVRQQLESELTEWKGGAQEELVSLLSDRLSSECWVIEPPKSFVQTPGHMTPGKLIQDGMPQSVKHIATLCEQGHLVAVVTFLGRISFQDISVSSKRRYLIFGILDNLSFRIRQSIFRDHPKSSQAFHWFCQNLDFTVFQFLFAIHFQGGSEHRSQVLELFIHTFTCIFFDFDSLRTLFKDALRHRLEQVDTVSSPKVPSLSIIIRQALEDSFQRVMGSKQFSLAKDIVDIYIRLNFPFTDIWCRDTLHLARNQSWLFRMGSGDPRLFELLWASYLSRTSSNDIVAVVIDEWKIFSELPLPEDSIAMMKLLWRIAWTFDKACAKIYKDKLERQLSLRPAFHSDEMAKKLMKYICNVQATSLANEPLSRGRPRRARAVGGSSRRALSRETDPCFILDKSPPSDRWTTYDSFLEQLPLDRKPPRRRQRSLSPLWTYNRSWTSGCASYSPANSLPVRSTPRIVHN